MRKVSRRHKENLEKLQNTLFSSLEEAILSLKETATAKFVESVELHANLNIDPKYADQQLRTTVSLPHGIGKQSRIAVPSTIFIALDTFVVFKSGNLIFAISSNWAFVIDPRLTRFGVAEPF